MIRVLIVDDHAVVRQGLRLLLGGEVDIEVIGEASDGEMALQQIQALQPDVVLLDLLMPGLSGIEVLKRLDLQGVSTRVLVLTSSIEDHLVKSALAAGALGYLLKTSRSAEVVSSIHQVASGNPVLDAEAARIMIQSTRRNDPLEILTAREREVFELVARGHNSAEVAKTLVVSDATVRTHVANLLEKLGLRDRVQIMSYALKRGIVQPNDLR